MIKHCPLLIIFKQLRNMYGDRPLLAPPPPETYENIWDVNKIFKTDFKYIDGKHWKLTQVNQGGQDF